MFSNRPALRVPTNLQDGKSAKLKQRFDGKPSATSLSDWLNKQSAPSVRLANHYTFGGPPLSAFSCSAAFFEGRRAGTGFGVPKGGTGRGAGTGLGRGEGTGLGVFAGGESRRAGAGLGGTA